MHRSDQILFLPHAKLKQRERMSAGHFLFFIAATYMLENQNGYIYKQLKNCTNLLFSFNL
ncbi:hypothetical protein CON65_24050 [Bacillus pseudomycoides]|uniref:Uncharacterized protein n=1 Tax=Bacillus pseudomycoides TaxID=64104 RepID=A0AA91V7T6_9BACI|nr:hypothetical protein CON65_24050 [Bacillus pseudomycoides]PEU11001.1 hypothetical protein CN525_22885 [Bacillus sp. AFS014408]